MKIIKNETFSEKQITGEIKDKKFVGCTFSDLIFDKAVITNCEFKDCNVLDSVGNQSKIRENIFSNTVVKDVGIVKGKI